MLVLVMVRIHIDNEHIVELALHRLLARMREKSRRIELVHGDAPAAFSNEVHV